MAKIIHLKPKGYTDESYVLGVANHDQSVIRELERHCRTYYDSHYRGVFFCGDEKRLEIFQDAFIVLWEKIEHGNIYVKDGVIYSSEGTPFSSSLTTYLMSIARLKNLEHARNSDTGKKLENKRLRIELGMMVNADSGESKDDDIISTMEEVIAYCISVMSEQCNKILTKFYYEEKSLDVILNEIPTITNKNALKTRKYKCMELLKSNACSMYKRVANN